MSGEEKIIIEATVSSCCQSKCSCNFCKASSVGFYHLVGFIVLCIAACVILSLIYLINKEGNHKREIEHKAYQKYIFMLEDNKLQSIDITEREKDKVKRHILIKKGK